MNNNIYNVITAFDCNGSKDVYKRQAVSVGQPVPGCISVEALRQELVSREKEPKGYYNT